MLPSAGHIFFAPFTDEGLHNETEQKVSLFFPLFPYIVQQLNNGVLTCRRNSSMPPCLEQISETFTKSHDRRFSVCPYSAADRS